MLSKCNNIKKDKNERKKKKEKKKKKSKRKRTRIDDMNGFVSADNLSVV